MAGATSLVQLILKKWGDDIAGAAKELEEKVGFPESVANRIATGELPMDEASRQARKAEQGYGDTYLHGGAEQITELDGGLLGSATGAKTAKQAFWATKDPRTAGSYANHAAKDAPVRRKLEEANNAGNSGDWDKHDRLIDEAEALEREVYNQPLQGQMVTPVTVKGPMAQMEAGGRSFDDFGMSDEISERIRGARHDGFGGVEISDLDDAVGLSNQPADHLAAIDLEAVRSPNAAFDPQYTGPNIMGGAALPIAAGLLAMGQSDDADAGVLAKLMNPDVAYNQLRKQIARNKQKGISPGNTVKQWIHDKSNSNYDHMGSYAKKLDGGMGGDYYKEQTQSLVDQLLGDVENPDKDLLAGIEEWSGIRQSRELGYVPKYRQRGNAGPGLLAGVTGMTAAGLAAPMIKDSGMISAPRSETLFDLTMGARDIERRLEGSLASLLFPSGLVEYLETVNRREEDPNAMTRGMALLDVLPF